MMKNLILILFVTFYVNTFAQTDRDTLFKPISIPKNYMQISISYTPFVAFSYERNILRAKNNILHYNIRCLIGFIGYEKYLLRAPFNRYLSFVNNFYFGKKNQLVIGLGSMLYNENDIELSRYVGKFKTLYFCYAIGYKFNGFKKLFFGLDINLLHKIVELNRAGRQEYFWISGPNQAPYLNQRAVSNKTNYASLSIGYKF